MTFPKPQIVGQSEAIKKILELTRKVSNVDLNVLITGESGVGKELVARSLHYYSDRRNAPFIKVNCATLPSELLESELFGYEKGAFTGADKQKLGKFELAKEGSFFLDEIGEMSNFLQAKLLQVLQDRIYQRVGGYSDIKVKARVIAATNQNLNTQINNNFRDDLYYRLSTISIHIPPLRERKEDIIPLIEHFMEKQKRNKKHPELLISKQLMDVFNEYYWPGNVRELENYLNRLHLLKNEKDLIEQLTNNKKREILNSSKTNKTQEEVTESDTDTEMLDSTFPSLKEVRDQAIQRVEKAAIEKALNQTRWNRKEAAKILKISYRALLYKMKDLDISPPSGNSRRL